MSQRSKGRSEQPPLSSLADWTPEQIAQGKQWVRAWATAGEAMERLRREELRRLDGASAIAPLCGPGNYRVSPRAPRPTSGLVEQQRWFMLAYRRILAAVLCKQLQARRAELEK